MFPIQVVFGLSGFCSSSSPVFLFADFFLFQGGGAFGAEQFFFEQFAHSPPGVKAVQGLAAGFLHFDFQFAGFVAQINTGGGFVDFLAAGSRAANEFFFQVLLAQAAVSHPLGKFIGFFWGNTKINQNSEPLLQNVKSKILLFCGAKVYSAILARRGNGWLCGVLG